MQSGALRKGIDEGTLGEVTRPHHASVPVLPLHREDPMPDLESGCGVEPKPSVKRTADEAPGRRQLGGLVHALGLSETASGEQAGGERLSGRYGGGSPTADRYRVANHCESGPSSGSSRAAEAIH